MAQSPRPSPLRRPALGAISPALLVDTECTAGVPPPVSVGSSDGGSSKRFRLSSQPASRLTPRPPPVRTRGSFGTSPQPPDLAQSAPNPPDAAAPASRQGRRPPPIHTRSSFGPLDRDSSPECLALPVVAGHRESSAGGERTDGASPRQARQERRGAAGMSLVAERLFVGSELSARSLPNLRAHGVTHVVNCATLPNAHEGRPGAPSYLKLDLLDSVIDLPRMPAALAEAAAFIRDAHGAGGTVLVHCHRGISRSCTVAMAYLIAERRCTAETIFDELRRARPVCDPNLGYWVTLKEWERQLGIVQAEPERRDEQGALRGGSGDCNLQGGDQISRPSSRERAESQPTSPAVVGAKRGR